MPGMLPTGYNKRQHNAFIPRHGTERLSLIVAVAAYDVEAAFVAFEIKPAPIRK